MTTPSAVSAVTSRTSGSERRSDDQRVVAGGLERVGQVGEDARAGVEDGRGLAVHELGRRHDPGRRRPGRCTGGRGTPRGWGAPRRARPPRPCSRPPSSGRPGPGEMTMASGAAARMPGDVDGVVAEDDGLGSELTQLLDQVVGEGVVVVDEQDPGAHGRTTVPARTEPGGPAPWLSSAMASKQGPGGAARKGRSTGRATSARAVACTPPPAAAATRRRSPQSRRSAPSGWGRSSWRCSSSGALDDRPQLLRRPARRRRATGTWSEASSSSPGGFIVATQYH